MIHHTVGVYRNGETKHNGVDSAALTDHIVFNKIHRPGRALFVDGVLVYPGDVDPDTLKVARDYIKTVKPIVVDTRSYC